MGTKFKEGNSVFVVGVSWEFVGCHTVYIDPREVFTIEMACDSRYKVSRPGTKLWVDEENLRPADNKWDQEEL